MTLYTDGCVRVYWPPIALRIEHGTRRVIDFVAEPFDSDRFKSSVAFCVNFLLGYFRLLRKNCKTVVIKKNLSHVVG